MKKLQGKKIMFKTKPKVKLSVIDYEERLIKARETLISMGIIDIKPLIKIKKSANN